MHSRPEEEGLPPLRVFSTTGRGCVAEGLPDLEPVSNIFSTEDMLFIDNVLLNTHLQKEESPRVCTSGDSVEMSLQDVEDKALRRKMQNRLSSARFRAKQKAREKEVELLREQVAELERENHRLESIVFALESQILVAEEAAQQTTIEWVLSKFRLKRKVSFFTYGKSVQMWLDLWESTKKKRELT